MSASTGMSSRSAISLTVAHLAGHPRQLHAAVQVFPAHQGDDRAHRAHVAALHQHVDAFRHVHDAGLADNVAELLHPIGHDRGIDRAGQIAGAGRDFADADRGGGLCHLQILRAFHHPGRAFDLGDRTGDFQLFAGLG